MTGDTNTLLTDVAAGKPGAADALYSAIYRELRGLAGRLLKGERPDHTLQTTALVNEAYLRLISGQPAGPATRTHFMALAARAMRCILCDHARRRRRLKRGGGRGRAVLEESIIPAHEGGGINLVELDDALARLREINERAAAVVEMRFFGGLPMEEIAAALDTSLTTVEREWRYARAWLLAALRGEPPAAGAGAAPPRYG